MTHIITFGCQLNKQQKKCKTINVIISDEAKTLHFVGQMYKSDYFTEEQMTKYEILSDSKMVWDKTLAHFTELFSLRKAYGDDRAANSGFESAAHIRDHSSAHSIITATTESDLTRNLYIESLEESLAVAREQYASDATTRTPIPPAFDPLTLLQTELVEQRKQVSDVMAQNAKLIATLSKGGGGDGKGGDNSNQGKGKGPESQDNDTALQEWINKNKPPHSATLTPVHNYWTPLASQVEELDNPPLPLNHLLSLQQAPPHRRVTFALSPHHVNKDSTIWRRGRPPNEHTTYHINPLAAQHNMRMGVLNGTIPSAVSNTPGTYPPRYSTSQMAPLHRQPHSTNCSTTSVHLPGMSTLSLHWLKTHSSAPANLPPRATQPSTTRMR